MDPVLALVVITIGAFATILVILWYMYKTLRRMMVYIKSQTVFEAEAVANAEELAESAPELDADDTEVNLTQQLQKKQKEAYDNL